MEGGELFGLAVVAVVVALMFFGVRTSKKAGIERNRQLREMATRLGLEYSEQPPAMKYFAPNPTVAGVFAGRAARLHEFSRGSGKNRTHWVAARMECRGTSSLKLSIRSQGAAVFEKIASALGYKDIVIGDAAFDSKFVIHGNDEDFIKAALLPEIRMKIAAFWPRASGGRIKVENGEAVYEQQGYLTKAACRDNLEKAFPILADLAAIAEVHGGGK